MVTRCSNQEQDGYYLYSSLISIIIVSVDIKHHIYLDRDQSSCMLWWPEAVAKSKTVTILKRNSGRTDHPLHKPGKAPESIHFILHDDQNRRQQVTHALDITWRARGKAKKSSVHDSEPWETVITVCTWQPPLLLFTKVSLWCTEH